MTIGVMVISWATYSHGYGLDISEFNYEDVVMSSKVHSANNIFILCRVLLRLAYVA